MNRITIVKQATNVQSKMFKFGLSTLLLWIRCFEGILHISYKLDIKKWQVFVFWLTKYLFSKNELTSIIIRPKHLMTN